MASDRPTDLDPSPADDGDRSGPSAGAPAGGYEPGTAGGIAEDAVVALRGVIIAGERYRAAVAERFGIGTVESVVLSLLTEAGQPLTPHQIGRRMMLSSGTVTAILDRLEHAGHIRRTQHPTDRRSRLIVLTPAGRRVVQYSNGHLHAVIASSADGGVTPELMHALRRIAHLLDERTAIVHGA